MEAPWRFPWKPQERAIFHTRLWALYYMQQIIGFYVHGSVGQRLETFSCFPVATNARYLAIWHTSNWWWSLAWSVNFCHSAYIPRNKFSPPSCFEVLWCSFYFELLQHVFVQHLFPGMQEGLCLGMEILSSLTFLSKFERFCMFINSVEG